MCDYLRREERKRAQRRVRSWTRKGTMETGRRELIGDFREGVR